MNIKFIGLITAGKSTYGKSLANQLNYDFKDLDHEVEKEMGLEISQMYEVYKEHEITEFFIKKFEDLSKKSNTIIATGGYFGCTYNFIDHENIFFLDIGYDLFMERIEDARNNLDKKENKNRRILKDPLEVSVNYYHTTKPKYIERATHRYEINEVQDYGLITEEVKKRINKLKEENQSIQVKKPINKRKL